MGTAKTGTVKCVGFARAAVEPARHSIGTGLCRRASLSTQVSGNSEALGRRWMRIGSNCQFVGLLVATCMGCHKDAPPAHRQEVVTTHPPAPQPTAQPAPKPPAPQPTVQLPLKFVPIAPGTNPETVVGQWVEVSGRVSDTKIPQVEAFHFNESDVGPYVRNKKVSIRGLVRKQTIAEAPVQTDLKRLQGAPQTLGAGTTYWLDHAMLVSVAE